MRKIALLALTCLIPLSAARITLRDGSVINGTFVSGSERSVVFRDEAGIRRTYDTNEIRTIDFDAGFGSSTSSSNVFGRRGSADRIGSESTRGDRRLPAGTEVSVRTNERIESESAVAGHTYSAQIEKDVVGTSGDIVIPRGSDARLVVRNVDEGGRVSGSKLALDLESIIANGQTYMVSTEEVERGSDRGVGANRRTAEMVGGGAVLGTVIGAIAGGGKGAAIGAAVGAAAGAGTQILTKGDKIRVPAETVLNFRLDRPLRLRAMQ
jgi:hypothetical protein